MPAYEWQCVKKQDPWKTAKKVPPIFEVSSHPLRQNMILSKKDDILEKLNAAFDSDDPLLKFAQENINVEKDEMLEASEKDVDFNKNWNAKKNYILHKYTTIEKLSIVSSFLPHDDKFAMNQVSNLNEQVKHRLEQLDYFEESSMKRTIGLTQQDFMTKINLLSDELKKAWNEEQRVKAFKIAIQCSKLLSDTGVIQFYPSKFVLICDMLDMFGELVYNRLREKCFEYQKPSFKNEEIDPDRVSEAAKETCQNWLYKMASIRELLPRLYIEMALLRCYTFLSKNECNHVIARLATMIRGIGNPLVALYLRVYLCRVAMKLPTKNMDCFYVNIKEFLLVYKQISKNPWKKEYLSQGITSDVYLELYIPALDWLLFGALQSGISQHTLLEEYMSWCHNTPNNELMLCCIISSFDSVAIVDKTLNILDMIQANEEHMTITHEILVSLGEHLCKGATCRQLSSEALIQIWWKMAANIKSVEHFLKVLEPWLQFACTQLTTKHVNFILRGTIKHMVKLSSSVDEHSNLFQAAVKRMLKSVPYVEEIFLMDAFMPLVELIQTPNARTLMAKTILTVFFDRFNTENYIMDHIVISGLMRLCCVIHNSITAITVEDELKINAELISKFIQSVRFEDDLEQQLNFYVECRSAFIKLDDVLATLVHAVNRLAIHASPSACAAYCFVTIPSLHCHITKGQLYLLSGQVALLNNCIGQAEAFFKVFVGMIPNLPIKLMEDGQLKCTQIRVMTMFTDFLSTLLILPDNVDGNCKAYVLNGFLKSLDMLQWPKTEPIYYNTLLCSLDLLAHMKQDNYIYHIDSVLSNDMLYGSEYDFTHAIDTYATTVCEELLIVLKTLGDVKHNQKQSTVTLELFWRVIKCGDLHTSSMASLAAKLWALSQKLKTTNTNFRNNILSTLSEEDQSNIRQLLKNGDKAM